MNCVLYARVSTDKQAEKELSIPAQVQAMRDYARQHEWVIVSEFIEPGASAKTTVRPALQDLLATIKGGGPPIDVVLVHKIDRLARNVYDHATIRALLQQRHIRLASVVENVDDTVSGQLVENIMASIAQFYSSNLSDEVKKGMRQKVLQGGWPHRPPRGYVLLRPVGSTSTAIETHPKDGPLMKRGFELYATGWYSIKALATRLAKEGLVAANGAPISHAHLRRLLANSFYAGSVRWHDLECPGTHPALISQELFDKVQAVLLQRYKNPGAKGSVIEGFPLRGLATCASCRGRMTTERHRKLRYYRCSRQTYRRDLCLARMCNADRIHAALERLVKSIAIGRPLAGQIATAAGNLIAARVEDSARRREQLERAGTDLIAREMALTRAFTSGDLAPNPYREQVAVVRAERQALANLEVSAPISADQLSEGVSRILQVATSLWTLYDPMSDVRRATLLKSVFDTIVIDHDGIAGFLLKAPFSDLVMPNSGTDPTQLAKAVIEAA